MLSNALYYNQNKFPSIAKDYSDAKNRAEKITNEKCDDKDENLFNYAFAAIPQMRRIESVGDKLDNNQLTSALGMASLALINFPEDCRDLKSAAKQIKSAITREKFEPSYDYKKYQHPFSFFRGTVLKNFANPNVYKHPEFANKLLKSDKTLTQTAFGKKILDFLGVKKVDQIETKIKSIKHTEVTPAFVNARIYGGNAFGKLTARALERCTVWGLGAMALLEIPQIISSFGEGDSALDKAENGAKQILKSGITVATVTAGIGYMGAIGSKYGGSAGSLIGMGIGAAIGGYGSKKLQEIIS